MEILKVINNNVVSSLDENGKEVVVMGKGIGFQKKTGNTIDEDKIEKIFCLPSEKTSQFEDLVEDMPYEHIVLAKEIIQYARKTLDRHLNKNIYITLTDHLNFAIERQKAGTVFQNALLWEIKKFYNKEYEIGLKAIDMVKDELGIELSEDEAGFMALHFVNAEMDGDIRQTTGLPAMIKDIVNIVRYHFGIDIDESTLSFERFVTHLKFFLQRVVKGECYEVEDSEFNESIKRRYKSEYACAGKIKDYMEKKVDYAISDEELTYLTLHISRVIRRTESSEN